MGSTLSTILGIFALVVFILAPFMSIITGLVVILHLDQVDTFLTRKVSIDRGFTPEVQMELQVLVQELRLDYSRFNFSGTSTEKVEWGEVVTISYEYTPNFTQRALEMLGIDTLQFPRREYQVVVTGR